MELLLNSGFSQRTNQLMIELCGVAILYSSGIKMDETCQRCFSVNYDCCYL